MDFIIEAPNLLDRLIQLCELKYIEKYGKECFSENLKTLGDLVSSDEDYYAQSLIENENNIMLKLRLILTDKTIEKSIISEALQLYNNLLFVQDEKQRQKIYDPKIIMFQPNQQDINCEHNIAKEVCVTISILFKNADEKLLIDFIDNFIGIIDFLQELQGHYVSKNQTETQHIILGIIDKIVDLGEQKHRSLSKNFCFLNKKYLK